MRSHSEYGANTSFLDLLFNMLLAFVCMFVLAFSLMNANEEKANYESHAEFLITTTWPEGMNDDVDTYVADPFGHLVMFLRRENGLMHLDRDDRGTEFDKIETPDGSVECKDNREIVTIRGIAPGEHIVNVHAYNLRSGIPVPVRVRVEKLNPYRLVADKEVILQKNGDEKTIVRFSVRKDGHVESTNELHKKLSSFGNG